MIVRNEAKVIRRCLESVRPFIDAWSISDTGSTDGTQDLIREALAGIPGTLIERPWVDFSTNRNEAIEAGLAHAPDFFMTLDADEVFQPEPGFELDLKCDITSVMFRLADTSARWPRRVFFRPHLRYRFVLDEVLEEGETQDILPACGVLSYPDGARSQNGMIAKYNADVEVLRRAVEREPNEPRYWFYLAQRLMGAQRWEEALTAYRQRLSMEAGFPEERFQSAFMIGQILEEMGHEDRGAIERQYKDAWLLAPQRAEPLFALAMLHSQAGEHALTEVYARAAQRLQRPPSGLPVDEAVYAWRAADLLAGALAEQGKFQESLHLLERLEPLPQLPDSERPRIRENIETIKTAMGPAPEFLGADEATYQDQVDRVREKGLAGFRALAREYLANPGRQALPGPVRWLWILMLRWFGRHLTEVSALTCIPALWWATAPFGGHALVAAMCPLLLLLSGRVLQDTTVAALTLAALGSAAAGNPWALALAVLALGATKEASVLAAPAIAFAWWCSGASWAPFIVACLTGGALAALGGISLLRDAWWPVLRAGSKSHVTPYTKDQQQGAPHRLLVDLVMVSPVATLMGLFGDWRLVTMAGLLLVAHAMAPVRNVRLVLAADLLLRASAVSAFGWWSLATVPADILIYRRLRGVYDPVTSVLARELGMSR